jgi:hypothetical protein
MNLVIFWAALLLAAWTLDGTMMDSGLASRALLPGWQSKLESSCASRRALCAGITFDADPKGQGTRRIALVKATRGHEPQALALINAEIVGNLRNGVRAVLAPEVTGAPK